MRIPFGCLVVFWLLGNVCLLRKDRVADGVKKAAVPHTSKGFRGQARDVSEHAKVHGRSRIVEVRGSVPKQL